jgi:hypothetical protein
MRLEQQLNDLRQAVDEEAKVNAYIVYEKFPQELDSKRQVCKEF